MIPIVGKIEIAQTLQSNLFDHKAVLLDFKKVRQGISRPCISRKILDADHISTVVWGAILETYVLNSGLDREIQNGFLREIGRVKSLIRRLGPPLAQLSEKVFSYSRLR